MNSEHSLFASYAVFDARSWRCSKNLRVGDIMHCTVYSLAESITTNLRICHTWMCTILSTLTSLYLRRMLFKIKRFLFNESKNITSKYVAFSDNFLLAYLFNKQIVRIYIVSCTVDVNIEFYYFFLSQN